MYENDPARVEAIARRLHALELRGEASTEKLAEAVAEGLELGVAKIVANPELMEKFWTAGYTQLTDRAAANTSQWVGKRILVAAATAALGWLIVYLARNGGIK